MSLEFAFFSALPERGIRSFTSEPEDINRNKFIRDRDRILFCKEFRRLEGKTQVFVAGFDDHIRNRLTHTLEVSQIAQSLSRYFGFNETLTEAISLGHDVGHTPFGHVGERLLNYFTNNCDVLKDFKVSYDSMFGFKHNLQGAKVVSDLEKISPIYNGLNLTDNTIWGIINHSGISAKKCDCFTGGVCNFMRDGKKCEVKDGKFSLNHYNKYISKLGNRAWSFEALIVKMADEIAQRHHDIEDGIFAGLISPIEIVKIIEENFRSYFTEDEEKLIRSIRKSNNLECILHDLSKLLLRIYSSNFSERLEEKLIYINKKYKIRDKYEFYNAKEVIFDNEISPNMNIFSKDELKEGFFLADEILQKFLKLRILNSHLAQSMDGKANYLLRNILEAYLTNPMQLPDATIMHFFRSYLSVKDYKKITDKYKSKELNGYLRNEINSLHSTNNDRKYKNYLLRTLVDFIAGMTDGFAINQYKLLYRVDNYDFSKL